MIGPNPQINASTNRIKPRTSPLEYYDYDAAGNMKTGQSGDAILYDAENKLVQYQGGATQMGGADYAYDGGENRVKKATPSETLIFVYNVSGQLVAEYTTSTPEQNGTSYLTSDLLGSPRAITKADGNVRARHDYLPFGEELYASAGNRTTEQKYDDGPSPTDKTRQKFTSKERDRESGLDYFGARYYASTHGRFAGVDPSSKSVQLKDPQSLNRYNYVLNNPLLYVDRNGKWPTSTHNLIAEKAFPTLDKSWLRAIQTGSRQVDRDGVDPKTLREANAPQHAMTPGTRVRELGSVSAAQAWARSEAISFVETNLNVASGLYEQASYTRTGLEGSLLAFGAAMHTVMDNASPTHRDFQVYDTRQYSGSMLMLPNVPGFVTDMAQHANGESRNPTETEMNQMVDEMRLRFYEVYGEDAYNRAIPVEERKRTEERLGQRGTRGMLYSGPPN
jgi:RHS repeat-associated protein